MKRAAIIIMLITMISKILGFARDMTLSYFYGASNISDAYLISLSIPGVIFTFVGIAILTGYIPIYSEIENNYGTREGYKYTSNLINILIMICTIIIIFGFLSTEQIVKVFAKGFNTETLILATKFTKISLLGIYFTAMIYIFNGFLQVNGNYMAPALTGFPLNVITILSVLLSSKINIMILAIGSVLAIFSQLIILIPFIRREGYRYKLILDLKDENIKKMACLAIPVIIGASVDQINVLVDRTLASSIAVGGISALNYANKLNLFIQGIFVTSVSTVMYPVISKMVAQNNIDGLKNTVFEAINSISILIIPVTVGALIFAEQIIRFLFGRGAFNLEAIYLTADALFFYSIGMVGYGFRAILSKAFYSLQDTKTPMINASIAVGINIILNIILSRFMGIGGLALATSISAIFCTVLLFISFRKKVGSFGMKNITISFLKILCASLIMGLMSKLSYNSLCKYISVNLSLIGAIGIGAVVYFVIIYFLKIDEVDNMIKIVKRKLKRSVENN